MANRWTEVAAATGARLSEVPVPRTSTRHTTYPASASRTYSAVRGGEIVFAVREGLQDGRPRPLGSGEIRVAARRMPSLMGMNV
ncbi:MAG: hypothetical protein ACRDHS_01120 [Actinomycetota bacterium]